MLNLSCIFPGQGSQSIGMLFEIAEKFPLINGIFDKVSMRLGYDVWDLIQNGSEEQLNTTEYTQVAMLTADVAIFELLIQQGMPLPNVMAGHSLGEYAALVCARSLSLTDAAFLVNQRGKIMQDCVPIGIGSMAAIVGLTDQEVIQICLDANIEHQQVTPANFNAIGQVVIAGHKDAVIRAINLAEKKEARLAKIIPVSVPCHCPLLYDASKIFAEYLVKIDFKTPKIPVLSNVDLSVYKTPEQIKFLLEKQLCNPVRWVEIIQNINKNYAIDIMIECGPGKILLGLNKRIDRKINTLSVYDLESLNNIMFNFSKEVL